MFQVHKCSDDNVRVLLGLLIVPGVRVGHVRLAMLRDQVGRFNVHPTILFLSRLSVSDFASGDDEILQ